MIYFVEHKGSRETMKRRYLSARVGDTDIAARVTFFSELTGEKFIELGAEDTIGDEFSLFADLGGHCGLRSVREGRSRVTEIYLEM
jgi:hypothetical protein